MGRVEQAQRTRAALMLAAADEFEKRGFAATSLTDVSDRLGLVRATVHFHFATKKSLAEALITHLSDSWTEIATRVGPDVPAGGPAWLRWACDQVAHGYATDRRQRAGLRLSIEHGLRPSAASLTHLWVERVAATLAPAGQQDRAAMLVQTFGGVLLTLPMDPERARTVVAAYWEIFGAALEDGPHTG